MTNFIYENEVSKDKIIEDEITKFLSQVKTFESQKGQPIIILQDGKSKGYYIKCNIEAKEIANFLDTNAKLDPQDANSFRANREILTSHNTYLKMLSDAKEGREFNDIIVEYNDKYEPSKPLKIWGGQHRSKALIEAYNSNSCSRIHGFKIYFNLDKKQRTEIALISNTNISVSNDLFDRLQEETEVGLNLRNWCINTGLMKKGEDFPDKGSSHERITVKLARTFVTNFFLGKEKSNALKKDEFDKNIYEPYLCKSGANLDPKYEEIIKKYEKTIWNSKDLIEAGKAFSIIHKSQYDTIKARKNDIENKKPYRNKALSEAVISAWAYVSGLLQSDSNRLDNHYSIPKTNKTIPDPLNAKGMSEFSHDSDDKTYRGLGTRSDIKERQRLAQIFLARALNKNAIIDKTLMTKAVSQVVGLRALQRGYLNE